MFDPHKEDTPAAPPERIMRVSSEVVPAGRWAFQPPRDEFSPQALLDLRSLNEKFAGEHGFVTRSKDGSDFAFADGTILPHYLSWNPIETPKPDFHRPEFFGELKLQEP